MYCLKITVCKKIKQPHNDAYFYNTIAFKGDKKQFKMREKLYIYTNYIYIYIYENRYTTLPKRCIAQITVII